MTQCQEIHKPARMNNAETYFNENNSSGVTRRKRAQCGDRYYMTCTNVAKLHMYMQIYTPSNSNPWGHKIVCNVY